MICGDFFVIGSQCFVLVSDCFRITFVAEFVIKDRLIIQSLNKEPDIILLCFHSSMMYIL